MSLTAEQLKRLVEEIEYHESVRAEYLDRALSHAFAANAIRQALADADELSCALRAVLAQAGETEK